MSQYLRLHLEELVNLRELHDFLDKLDKRPRKHIEADVVAIIRAQRDALEIDSP